MTIPIAQKAATTASGSGLLDQDSDLEEVSTTCGSGWVQTHAGSMLLNDPPATAGGTDLFQARTLILRIRNSVSAQTETAADRRRNDNTNS